VEVVPDTRPSACRCTRCGVDLGDLSEEARFCPVCGLSLSESRERPFSTTIVRGYAHAMFRLGTRYEVRHNDDEAVRCYDKSSRLGDARAAARLNGIPLATAVEDEDDHTCDTPAPDSPMRPWHAIDHP